MSANPGAANSDNADLFVVPIAQLMPQPCAVGEISRIEPGDVAGERVMLPRPIPDQRQFRPERIRNDVGLIADEDRPITQPREPGNVLDHLRVVIGGQERLMITAIRHRQPADEVGHPHVRGAFLLRILMQVVIQLPGLITDPQVVRLITDKIMKDHEIGQQDLIHATDRLEAVQVVLSRLGLDMT